MKVYVATASQRLSTTREYMKLFREKGYEITFDWTESFEEFEARNDSRELRARALRCIRGVAMAEACIAIIPDEGASPGTLIEIGAALGTATTVLVVAKNGKFDHFFTNHPRMILFDSFDDLFRFLDPWKRALARKLPQTDIMDAIVAALEFYADRGTYEDLSWDGMRPSCRLLQDCADVGVPGRLARETLEQVHRLPLFLERLIEILKLDDHSSTEEILEKAVARLEQLECFSPSERA